ncbi:hypothetical protein AB1Y20_010796 [Prymnesium parvum]|uniref:Glycosyl transferase family 1 domain-containing protein n=1 Tax=Prymnesium parvum TaxID=97485 RepID=A0AB34IQR2_PRYPA
MPLCRSEGGTFHYAGCGCSGYMPLPVPALVDDGVASARDAHHDRRSLRVLYLLPHQNLTGGMKMLVQQMGILTARGHQVIAAFRGATPYGRALPPWTSLQVAAEVLVSPTETFEQFLSRLRGSYDVCMVGYFTQLAELDNFWGPAIYWEQGHEHLFGEGRDPTLIHWDNLFHYSMLRSPVALAAVSDYTAKTLALQFGRRCAVIPNAVDCTEYYPPPEAAPAASPSRDIKARGHRVLLVGNPAQAFKGWDIALQALNLVHSELPELYVTWICQAQPQLSGVCFPLEFIVNPAQDELPKIYRGGHDVLLFMSRFEAWGMPVMEAMASGIAVVCSYSYGVQHFATDQENCLMVPSRDVPATAVAVLRLLRDNDMREALASRGRQTALSYSLQGVGDSLERALMSTAAFFEKCPHPPQLPRYR